MDDGPDYHQREEEEAQMDEQRLADMQTQAREERDRKFREAIEMQFPWLKTWKDNK